MSAQQDTQKGIPGRRESTSLETTRTLVQGYITKIQAGINPESNFRHLFETYHTTVLRFFEKRGFSNEERRDLTQEVFVRTYKGINSFRSEGHFEGWLFQVAANIYRNRIRDQSTNKRQAGEDSLEESLQILGTKTSIKTIERSGPLDNYLEKERLQALAGALTNLPEQMRRCVVLRIHHELKYREIAAVMRISIETVKAHLYQARRRLKDELASYFESFDL